LILAQALGSFNKYFYRDQVAVTGRLFAKELPTRRGAVNGRIDTSGMAHGG
jgi:hypothetical protein